MPTRNQNLLFLKLCSSVFSLLMKKLFFSFKFTLKNCNFPARSLQVKEFFSFSFYGTYKLKKNLPFLEVDPNLLKNKRKN